MITENWATAIDNFSIAQRAAGLSENSIRARREHLQHLARRVDSAPWKLTKAELVNYAGQQEWKPETRRGRRSTFNEFWKWGKRTKLTKKSPVKALPKVRSTKGTPDPMPEAAYARALGKVDPRIALMLRLAHDCGMRRGEIAVVHSRDLIEDFVGWSLLVHGKGRKRRVVPLTRRLALDLRAQGEGYAFEGDIDGHLSPRRVGELANEALPGEWTIHKLRHSFATRTLKEVGGNVFVVQDLLGHSSSETTRIYTAIDDADKRIAVEGAYETFVKLSLTPEPPRIGVVA